MNSIATGVCHVTECFFHVVSLALTAVIYVIINNLIFFFIQTHECCRLGFHADSSSICVEMEREGLNSKAKADNGVKHLLNIRDERPDGQAVWEKRKWGEITWRQVKSPFTLFDLWGTVLSPSSPLRHSRCLIRND